MSNDFNQYKKLETSILYNTRVKRKTENVLSATIDDPNVMSWLVTIQYYLIDTLFIQNMYLFNVYNWLVTYLWEGASLRDTGDPPKSKKMWESKNKKPSNQSPHFATFLYATVIFCVSLIWTHVCRRLGVIKPNIDQYIRVLQHRSFRIVF